MFKETIGYLVARADKSLKKRITSIVLDYHITVPQYGVLRRLYKQEGLTAADLVKQIYTDSSTMMSILDRLEEKGLIKKTPHATDRRMSVISLTDQSRAFLPEMITKVKRLEESLTKSLTGEELTVLRNGLTKLYEVANSKPC